MMRIQSVPTKSALSVRNLSVDFTRDDGGRVRALNQVSVEIAEGEFVCVLGRSGHGKTTMLNVIGGLLGGYDGEVLALVKKVTGPGIDRGVIFQTDAVFPWMRVEDNVAF